MPLENTFAFAEAEVQVIDDQIETVLESGLSEDQMAFNLLMTYSGT